MIRFNTADNKITFEVDGTPHLVRGLTVEDIPKVAEIQESGGDSNEALLDFMKSRMNAAAKAAFQKLSLPAMQAVVTEWTAGVPLGESSSSAE